VAGLLADADDSRTTPSSARAMKQQTLLQPTSRPATIPFLVGSKPLRISGPSLPIA
jgi:hypothetical protein